VQGTSFLVFHGPFGYVSPNWYTNPAASVPTWNYVAVHVHGRIERIDGLQDKLAIVDALSARHEAAFARPWTSAKMDPPVLERMLGAIVGFRLIVERVDAKFKLSQNRSGDDRTGVIAGLEGRGTSGADLLAAWMREYAQP
jgi:transcriptional regulator